MSPSHSPKTHDCSVVVIIVLQGLKPYIILNLVHKGGQQLVAQVDENCQYPEKFGRQATVRDFPPNTLREVEETSPDCCV